MNKRLQLIQTLVKVAASGIPNQLPSNGKTTNYNVNGSVGNSIGGFTGNRVKHDLDIQQAANKQNNGFFNGQSTGKDIWNSATGGTSLGDSTNTYSDRSAINQGLRYDNNTMTFTNATGNTRKYNNRTQYNEARGIADGMANNSFATTANAAEARYRANNGGVEDQGKSGWLNFSGNREYMKDNTSQFTGTTGADRAKMHELIYGDKTKAELMQDETIRRLAPSVQQEFFNQHAKLQDRGGWSRTFGNDNDYLDLLEEGTNIQSQEEADHDFTLEGFKRKQQAADDKYQQDITSARTDADRTRIRKAYEDFNAGLKQQQSMYDEAGVRKSNGELESVGKVDYRSTYGDQGSMAYV